MYSICVKQHFIIPKNKNYGILVMIKQDGIDESGRIMGLYDTQEKAKDEFVYRVRMILAQTQRQKENEEKIQWG